MVILSKKQHEVIRDVIRSHNFKTYSIEVEKGTEKGDNYLGIITNVKIKERDRNKYRELCLILKFAETNKELRKRINLNLAYTREVRVYETILPTFEKIQQQHTNLTPFLGYTKLYGFGLDEDEEFLVMPDLRTQGYKILDRRIPMDEYHIEAVMREMAKFHSMSFVAKHLHPEDYESITTGLTDYLREDPRNVDSRYKNLPKQVTLASKLVEKYYPVVLNALLRQENNQLLADETEDEKLVICHNDLWCNNIMFKYENPDKPSVPTEVVFIDWQLTRVGSPAWDILFFLFLSAPKRVLDQHKYYLKIYLDVIHENLRKVDLDPKQIFPKEVLEAHFRRLCKSRFFSIMGNMNFLLKDINEVKTLVEISNDGPGDFFDNCYSYENCTEVLKGRLRDILIMLHEQTYM